MDTRRLIVALLAAMAAFYLWLFICKKFWPTPPPEQEIAADGTPATASAPGTGPVGTRPAWAAGTAPAATPTDQGQPGMAVVQQGDDPSPIVLGDASADSPYPMGVEIAPEGAAVSSVTIRGYYEKVDRKDPYCVIEPVPLTDTPGDGKLVRSFGTRLRFEDLKLDARLDDKVWKRIEVTPERAVLGLDLFTPDGEPLARVLRTYTLTPQPAGARTYDLGLSLEIESRLGRPCQVIVIQQGPTGLRSEELRSEDRMVVSAFWDDGEISTKTFQRKGVFKKPNHKQEIGSDGEGKRIAWVADGNKYFGGIMAPSGRTGPDDQARFARVEVLCLTGVEDESASQRQQQDLTFQYITNPMTIAAGGTVNVAFDCYIGPKSKSVFEAVPAYAQRHYYYVITASFMWCALTPIVNVMIWLLDVFHAIPPRNYGISIVVLVLLVRAALHPITKRSQVNMMRMQKRTAALQPRVQAAKEKYANDKVKLNQAIMEIYREEGINPAGNLLTCLPLFLQIPIWGALWTALAYTIEMRHAPLDGWWIKDLTQPDTFWHISDAGIYIPILSDYIMSGPLKTLNLLPILLGITQVLQARYMPRGSPSAQPGGNPDQLEQQRKMMMVMSVVFIFVLYNAPSGLTLYIMASNIFGILEQWRIRQHLAQAEAKGEKTVEKPKKDKPAVALRESRQPTPRKEKAWFFKLLERLQKSAEEAKRIESPRKKDRGL